MTWFRVAVAAAIILIAGFATLKLVNTNENGDIPPVVKIEPQNDQPSNKKEDSSISNPGNQIPKDNLVKSDKEATKEQTINKNSVDKNNEPKPLIAQRENKNNLPDEKRNIDLQSVDTDALAQGDMADIHMQRDTRTTQTNQSDVIIADIGTQDVTLKANPTLYIPKQEEKEGGGIKEFLRKTTRVFERRTKIQTTTDDNKLLVGAFAVSLK